MKLVSTRSPQITASIRDAVLNGLAPDGGLYVPEIIPKLSPNILSNLENLSLEEISLEVAKLFFESSIPETQLRDIVYRAINFSTPLVPLDKDIFSLELFCGPSMAFKDFGARFMAELMSWYVRDDNEPLDILVATSGDTGGAVALGFLGVPGINVSILYPKGRVSDLQELQLTTNGENITAYEVDGSFDDCQAIAKKAFTDSDLRAKKRLSSANSINIARLIPQSFYYLHALGLLYKHNSDYRAYEVSFSIPSGNFGNLCAGLFSKLYGAEISKFLAATNVNDTVPQYLATGEYLPQESIQTISNAMDVGAPSNFERLQFFLKEDLGEFLRHLVGYSYSDSDTRLAIKKCYQDFGYILDPHGAIGYLAAKEWQEEAGDKNRVVCFLETAHPIKFRDSVEKEIGREIPLPQQFQSLITREKKVVSINNQYEGFKHVFCST